MYQLIHFTVQDEDFPIPPSVEEYFISNPDVEHHNAYATFEILGKNTDYVVDPEECMADNFGFLIAYDKDGPEGKGYPNPEIIEGIRSYLQQK